MDSTHETNALGWYLYNPNRKIEAYIRKEWWDTMASWANYARCHSTLLLQVPSTNVVESWHASLKSGGAKAQMPRWSLRGLIEHITNRAYIWKQACEKDAFNYASKHLTDTARWPMMRNLPYPFQKLTLEQLHLGESLLSEGEEPRKPAEKDDGWRTCDCNFFRSWLLPCKDLWMAELSWGSILTEDVWKTVGIASPPIYWLR
jgi:hypothetical protein